MAKVGALRLCKSALIQRPPCEQGESVRKIQKMNLSFLDPYSDIEWDKIARFRDLVSHHYDRIDHEIVYDICKTHIPKLKSMLKKIHSELSSSDNK